MKKLPQPLVHVPLEIAEHLVRVTGRPLLRQAALRRAVSTAYYAVFHALCSVCADELVGWGTTIHEPIYRSVDHGITRTRLSGAHALAIGGSLRRIAVLFAHLQDQRHEADYSPPKALFSPRQAMALIEEAREAIDLIEALSPRDERRRLAILLIAHKRAL